MKDVRAFYDRTAPEWAERWYADESMLPVLKWFMDRLPPRPQVLDLCCGAGYESARMERLGAEVTGLDFSGVSLDIARERNPRLRFFQEDMLNDYSSIGQFDGVAVIAGLVHLANESLPLAFRRMAAVMKPDGLALLVVRDGTGKQEAQSYVMIDGEQYDRAFYAHTLDELIRCSNGLLRFEEELPNEKDGWRQYLFRKI